ncbi:hypothetical protein ACP_2266 [Acidobacterium capsulatum ATCC 51196]|uniref:Uncharacterized protein n=1 Tax=Acidobacterium capsulatum (strain ATCC 51196 / DSM 11244 / BCRC 80197 / JCM 7670 / NBRC 15755 / NCIMB 13165 / 161) TaxID=240015 RepID=C1FA71_ACIC5|nr:hypothetical protein ACP_2266 [Acidobacterium capsulatum ATCC 51196]
MTQVFAKSGAMAAAQAEKEIDVLVSSRRKQD